MKLISVILLLLLSSSYIIFSDTNNNKPSGLKITSPGQRISQYGITWHFDPEKQYQIGKFVNGDYWVVGPVNIVQIDPPWDGEKNGAMLNPHITNDVDEFSCTTDCYIPGKNLMDQLQYRTKQGYDKRNGVHGWYDSSYNVGQCFATGKTLVIQPGNSLVSIKCYDTIINKGLPLYWQTAAVLTVLDAVPPKDSFRPPFSGTDKRIKYTKTDLDLDILLNLEKVASTPKIESFYSRFQRPWLDHGGYETATLNCGPDQNMPLNGDRIADLVSDAALLLNSNFPVAQKESLAINMVQVGLDYYGKITATKGGKYRHGVGGQSHEQGRKWLVLQAGLLLNDSAMQHTDAWFIEDFMCYYCDCWTGDTVCWNGNHLLRPQDDYEHKDPSEWTDIDRESEGYRYCCAAKFWQGYALIARLMPNVMNLWNNRPFFDYVDRWMNGGYYPHYNQTFQEDMWNKYRYNFSEVVVFDDRQAVFTGNWTKVNFTKDNRTYSVADTTISSTARYIPHLTTSGTYAIFISYFADNDAGFATKAKATIRHTKGTTVRWINESDRHFRFRWLLQGTFDLDTSDSTYVEFTNNESDGKVTVDSVKFCLISQ